MMGRGRIGKKKTNKQTEAVSETKIRRCLTNRVLIGTQNCAPMSILSLSAHTHSFIEMNCSPGPPGNMRGKYDICVNSHLLIWILAVSNLFPNYFLLEWLVTKHAVRASVYTDIVLLLSVFQLVFPTHCALFWYRLRSTGAKYILQF